MAKKFDTTWEISGRDCRLLICSIPICSLTSFLSPFVASHRNAKNWREFNDKTLFYANRFFAWGSLKIIAVIVSWIYNHIEILIERFIKNYTLPGIYFFEYLSVSVERLNFYWQRRYSIWHTFYKVRYSIYAEHYFNIWNFWPSQSCLPVIVI